MTRARCEAAPPPAAASAFESGLTGSGRLGMTFLLPLFFFFARRFSRGRYFFRWAFCWPLSVWLVGATGGRVGGLWGISFSHIAVVRSCGFICAPIRRRAERCSAFCVVTADPLCFSQPHRQPPPPPPWCGASVSCWLCPCWMPSTLTQTCKVNLNVQYLKNAHYCVYTVYVHSVLFCSQSQGLNLSWVSCLPLKFKIHWLVRKV